MPPPSGRISGAPCRRRRRRGSVQYHVVHAGPFRDGLCLATSLIEGPADIICPPYIHGGLTEVSGNQTLPNTIDAHPRQGERLQHAGPRARARQRGPRLADAEGPSRPRELAARREPPPLPAEVVSRQAQGVRPIGSEGMAGPLQRLSQPSRGRHGVGGHGAGPVHGLPENPALPGLLQKCPQLGRLISS